MKCSLFMIVAVFLPLGACADSSEAMAEATISQELPEDVQEVLRRSVKNQVFVKGGSFQMGDIGAYITRESFNEGPLGSYEFVDKSHPDAMWLAWAPDYELQRPTAEPVHKVTLSSYSIGKYEVTFSEYDTYSKDAGVATLREDIAGSRLRKPNKPAIGATWHEATDFCQWLADKTGLNFSLPTEAQWEYAARSRGKDHAYATNTGMPEKGANIHSGLGTEKVGSYPPNPLGLHDMSGNAQEWVQDWFDPDYYKKSPEKNPEGPREGRERAARSSDVVFKRLHEAPDYRGYTLGFRCAANEEKPVTLK